jgi:hypothetical protein
VLLKLFDGTLNRRKNASRDKMLWQERTIAQDEAKPRHVA